MIGTYDKFTNQNVFLSGYYRGDGTNNNLFYVFRSSDFNGITLLIVSRLTGMMSQSFLMRDPWNNNPIDGQIIGICYPVDRIPVVLIRVTSSSSSFYLNYHILVKYGGGGTIWTYKFIPDASLPNISYKY